MDLHQGRIGGGGGPRAVCRLKYSYFVGSRLKVSIFVGKSQLISRNACLSLVFAMYFTHFKTLNSIKRVTKAFIANANLVSLLITGTIKSNKLLSVYEVVRVA